MFFNHPAVRAHLVKRRFVYTLRDHAIREGRHRLVHGGYFKNRLIGFGEVRLVKKVGTLTPIAIRAYVKHSGLKTAREWLDAFRSFTKGKRTGSVYVFRVDVATRRR